ncbi:DNA topoisomerase III [Pseudoflavonifractor sp. DSM 107456]|uniref:DNA topoisomerase 3 n=1 Tax=Pseudoflavonifractor gallinarum TaxID=2779352 RepID=A0ABR9RAB7_9FIRM|nr:DNA topoisomerase III [Pseudoflavonifractor gallinarum]MBE5055622.1 DNA topoisomerase III [Pseudoflavonifractor gallinarum]
MSKTLVLAEKPSVGRELARVLGCTKSGEGCLEGAEYIVTWALGHLVELSAPEEYDKAWQKWDLLTLPMLPEPMKTAVIPQSARQFRAVRALLHRGDVKELVIATDAGREGELVARWILEKAGWKGPTKRMWISSQTDRAIREGFAHLRPAAEYDNLFYSARARSEADWLVGLNVTRALTCKYNAQLSAGRVQTPTLALIVDREEAIRSFRPREFDTLQIRLEGFTATWRDGQGQARIFDREKARALAGRLAGKEAVIRSLQRKRREVPPPAAYDLTELQRDANRKYAYSAKETLSMMQSLYENHKVLTYPRTDSRYISQDVVPTLPERITSVAVDEYRDLALSIRRQRPLQTKYLVNDAKVSDHHAIIPTEEQVELWRMSGGERNIYDLVVRRFLAVLLPPCVYEEVRLTLEVDGETFTARGKVMVEPGWRAAYDRSFSDLDQEEDEDEREQALPVLREGERFPVGEMRLRPGQTAPPARYTEATLLTAMEHPGSQVEDREESRILEETGGLGTPATRADIIEKLFSSFYVERRGKEIVPTSKGVQVVKLAPADLRSAALTARWESRLGAIAQGKEREAHFVEEMRQYASHLVSEVKASDASYTHDNQTRTPCPDCGKYLLRVKTKRGEMLVCPDRECGYRRSVKQTTNARCPNCHKRMELRGEGEKQMFACVCGYREKLSDFKKRREKAGGGKRDVRRYLEQQARQEETGNSALAAQLAKWMEQNRS